MILDFSGHSIREGGTTMTAPEMADPTHALGARAGRSVFAGSLRRGGTDDSQRRALLRGGNQAAPAPRLPGLARDDPRGLRSPASRVPGRNRPHGSATAKRRARRSRRVGSADRGGRGKQRLSRDQPGTGPGPGTGGPQPGGAGQRIRRPGAALIATPTTTNWTPSCCTPTAGGPPSR